jgi:hypothetical protein
MKERPILFSTEMVQALLDGRKTMTRRVVKGAALDWLAPEIFTPEFVADPANSLCPYGQVGDVLWVRESFVKATDSEGDYVYKALSTLSKKIFTKWKPSIFMPKAACRLRLKITNVRVERLQEISEDDAKAEGIFYYDSPLFNEVRYADYLNLASDWREAISSFRSLWDSVNGAKKGRPRNGSGEVVDYSWSSNPWVWVVVFEKVE